MRPSPNESAVKNYLHPFVKTGRPIAPFLAAWSRLLPTPSAALHAARHLRRHAFDEPADYYGWHDLADPFAELGRWLRREELAAAIESAAATASSAEKRACTEAVENIRRELEYGSGG